MRGGTKTGLFFSELITVRWLVVEMHIVAYSKVYEFFCPEINCKTCMSVSLNIIGLICINRETPEIMAHLTRIRRFCSIFTQRTVKISVINTYGHSPDKIQHRHRLLFDNPHTVYASVAAERSLGSMLA